MLIAANGDFAGLLSGGCLEGDLRERSQSVIESGRAQLVTYDSRGPDDLIWGLGLGCEGAMHILLFRVGPDQDWQPLTHLARSLATYTPTAVGIVVESKSAELPVGSILLPERASPVVQAALENAVRSGRADWVDGQDGRVFALPLSLPPRLLLLGGGPDAAPVVDLAARQSWKVTVVDHRPAYAHPEHFPGAERVILSRPNELLSATDLMHFSAAVVMSHHLPSDLEYLRSLSQTRIPYVGLLGPALRRERLLSDLGQQLAQSLRPRLHAPVGLHLGGRTPESIALSIVAEIHAFVHLGEEASAALRAQGV
jgi:xanthine/CO dehydrogenase XdhC/CoxF family maturation factor